MAKSRESSASTSSRKRKKSAITGVDVEIDTVRRLLEENDSNDAFIELASDPLPVIGQMKNVFESLFPHLMLNVDFVSRSHSSREER